MGRIELEMLVNTRDLGGIRTADGRSVVSRRLIRSGELSKASDADIQLLKDYPVNLVIDLRSDKEFAERPDRVIEGAVYEHIAILEKTQEGITRDKDSDKAVEKKAFGGFSAEDFKRTMMGSYLNLISNPEVNRSYEHVMDLILENEGGAVLWHCMGGKDRAGLTTVLVLAALGCTKETIIEDYLMTNVYNRDMARVMAKQAPDPNMPKMPPMPEDFMKVVGALEDYVNIFFDYAEEHYGSFENYLKEAINFGEEKTARLRAKYLE